MKEGICVLNKRLIPLTIEISGERSGLRRGSRGRGERYRRVRSGASSLRIAAELSRLLSWYSLRVSRVPEGEGMSRIVFGKWC